MNIYILPVDRTLQPPPQQFLYPAHNKDYGVEQDFLIWLQKQTDIITNDPDEATWHYLPVFWTRWHINHNFGEEVKGLEDLQAGVDKAMHNDAKTFTITQFDGGTLINTGNAVVYSAAKTSNTGPDIPILCELHKQPLFPIKKRYLASFNGATNTHPLRVEMFERFKNRDDINLGGNLPTRFYIRWLQGKQFNINMMASYIALCPRGTSANSFRFYEAMQLGVAPCLIGDIDSRPFKAIIDWDKYSYYVKDIDELENLLNNLHKGQALEKGKAARKFFYNDLYYQKWCKYIIEDLGERAHNK